MAKVIRVSGIDRHIGSQLRTRRTELKISQRALARCLGVSVRQFQKYENGINRVSAATLFVLAAALDVPAAFFVAGLKVGARTLRTKI